MKKNLFFICFITFSILVCSSFKTDRIQPNKHLEIPSNKSHISGFIRPFKTDPDITAPGYAVGGIEFAPNGDALRRFRFPTLPDHGLPEYFVVKVINYNTPSELVTDSWVEYNINEPSDGSYYYYHGPASGGGSSIQVWGYYQRVSPYHEGWEINFVNGGTPYAYWWRDI